MFSILKFKKGEGVMLLPNLLVIGFPGEVSISLGFLKWILTTNITLKK